MNGLAIRAAAAIAAVYGFFLIFAQFSFIELLRAGGASPTAEKAVLGTMAVAGIAGGFFAAWRGVTPRLVKTALGMAAAAAAAAPVWHTMPGALVVAAVTGAALGVTTVGLSSLVPAWCGVAWVGFGTGLGYACCNIPAVFLQSPSGQAWIGAGFAAVGMAVVPSSAEWRMDNPRKVFPLWGAVAIFIALVWLDSAAFFIIQHTEDLKSSTWGDGMLWRNAAIHLGLAAVAGLWLARGGARSLPGVAWVLLAVAALAVNAESTRGFSGWFYPAGVSLYSAALVAWPGWFSGAADARTAAWRAAWLFAVAGWIGSANGIGMAQTLQHVPPVFVAGAGMVVLGVMILSDIRQWRAALAVAVVVLVAMIFRETTSASASSAVERGRQAYVAEGCIHCHSRYSRPGSADEIIWGFARGVKDVLGDEPVLIGNRRQGPDLTNIGARRSEIWLRLHFINPRSFSPTSSMPSYAHLIQSGKGQDLIAFLRDSGSGGIARRAETAAAWKPSGTATGMDGKRLFAMHCAICHGPDGLGDGPLAGSFPRPPANLVKGPFLWSVAGSDSLDERVARILKFGIPGFEMPGHETLGDAEILALTTRVLELRK